MKMAILGMSLDSRSRSSNIAGALRMIDAAAQCDPAPDIIIVPRGCDRVMTSKHMMTTAMSEMYAASIAAKAREWGVHIGFSRSRKAGTQDCETAVTVDVDGDDVAGPVELRISGFGDGRVDQVSPDSAVVVVLDAAMETTVWEADDVAACDRIAADSGRATWLVRAGIGIDCPGRVVGTSAGRREQVPGGFVVIVDV